MWKLTLKNRPKIWATLGVINILLLPLTLLYWLGFKLNFWFSRPYNAPVPVICIGNINIGGSGKTPATIAIADALIKAGKKVAILTRGYGRHNNADGVVLVRPQEHSAADVGDEALLLAAVAPTYVCADRGKSAKQAYADGAQVLLMDDGMQNHTLHKDFTIMMIGGKQQVGNGLLLPAGPLRQTIKDGCTQANAFLKVGEHLEGIETYCTDTTKPVYEGSLRIKNTAMMHGKRVVGVCAIANPENFWQSLEDCGAELVERFHFPDHHIFTTAELEQVFSAASRLQAQVATTAKDMVKLPASYKPQALMLEIELILPTELVSRILSLGHSSITT